MLDSTLFTNRKASLIISLVLLVAISFGGIFALINSQIPNQVSSAAKQTETTTTKKPGKVAASQTDDSTTSSSSSTTSSTSTTTTQKSTTTAPILFTATAQATRTDVSITQCTSAQYTFVGSVQANIPGTANWTWIRSDGTPTGSSGAVEFDETGQATSAIDPYEFTIFVGGGDSTGWVALQITWNGGSSTSNQASYTFTHAGVNIGVIPQGC